MFTTQNELFFLNFIGSPFVYSVQFLLEGFGVLSPHALISANNTLFGFDLKGIWRSDGSSAEYIQNPALRTFLSQNTTTKLDQSKIKNTVLCVDQLQNLVEFSYTTEDSDSNDITIGFSFNDPANPWTVFDFGRTAASNNGVFGVLISGDKFGNIWQQSISNTEQPSNEISIIKLTAESARLSAGFGTVGFGQLGYGGRLNV